LADLNATITLGQLVAALDVVAKEARARNQWEYDSLKNIRLEAKAEVCEELRAALMGEP
jgi:hypothetical protein